MSSIVFAPSVKLVSQGHYEATLGLAISGIKAIYDLEMLKVDEITTCAGIIYYGKKFLVKEIRGLKKKIKNIK